MPTRNSSPIQVTLGPRFDVDHSADLHYAMLLLLLKAFSIYAIISAGACTLANLQILERCG